MWDVSTYRVIGSIAVHAAAIFQFHTLVVTENKARVALATLHTHVLATRRPDYTKARLWA